MLPQHPLCRGRVALGFAFAAVLRAQKRPCVSLMPNHTRNEFRSLSRATFCGWGHPELVKSRNHIAISGTSRAQGAVPIAEFHTRQISSSHYITFRLPKHRRFQNPGSKTRQFIFLRSPISSLLGKMGYRVQNLLAATAFQARCSDEQHGPNQADPRCMYHPIKRATMNHIPVAAFRTLVTRQRCLYPNMKYPAFSPTAPMLVA